MKRSPLVTIAIPTYNRAETFLPEAVKSALGQTYPDIEVIVSDNCSGDGTETLVRSMRDPRLRYVRHARNRGANGNFNYCLEAARGVWFVLLQDDDLIDADFVESCMTAGGDSEAGLIRTGTRVIDGEGKVLSSSPNRAGGLSDTEFFRAWFRGQTVLYLCSTVFNTERLREAGGFQSRHQLMQDALADVRLAVQHGRVDVEPVKASFRRHAGEMTFRADIAHWCEEARDVLDLICEVAGNTELLRRDGLKFFADASYGKARAVQEPLKRLKAYATVWRKFGYCRLPAADHFVAPLYRLFAGTPLHHGIRAVRRKAGQA